MLVVNGSSSACHMLWVRPTSRLSHIFDVSLRAGASFRRNVICQDDDSEAQLVCSEPKMGCATVSEEPTVET